MAKMTQQQIEQAVEHSKINEVMAAARSKQVQSVGNVVIAVLQNFAPDVNLGMDVLVNILGATIANNQVDLAIVETALKRAVEQQQQMRKVVAEAAAAGGAGPKLVGPNGLSIADEEEEEEKPDEPEPAEPTVQ